MDAVQQVREGNKHLETAMMSLQALVGPITEDERAKLLKRYEVYATLTQGRGDPLLHFSPAERQKMLALTISGEMKMAYSMLLQVVIDREQTLKRIQEKHPEVEGG